MRRNLALAIVLAVAAALTGCATTDNANKANNSNTSAGNPPRDGVVDTNVNMPANTNSRTVSSNTGVVTNDNGNANTDSIKSVNHNANSNRKH